MVDDGCSRACRAVAPAVVIAPATMSAAMSARIVIPCPPVGWTVGPSWADSPDPSGSVREIWPGRYIFITPNTTCRISTSVGKHRLSCDLLAGLDAQMRWA